MGAIPYQVDVIIFHNHIMGRTTRLVERSGISLSLSRQKETTGTPWFWKPRAVTHKKFDKEMERPLFDSTTATKGETWIEKRFFKTSAV